MQRILDRAKQAGADHAVVLSATEEESTVRFARNRTTQHQEVAETNLVLCVAKDRQEAVVETNLLTPESVDALVDRAMIFAAESPPNPEFVEPIPSQEYNPTQTWFDSTADLTLADRVDAVRDMCEMAASRQVDLFGNLNLSRSHLAVANSSGLYAKAPMTHTKLSVTARTQEGNGSGQYTTSEGDWDMLKPMTCAESAVNTAIRSRNPEPFEPGEYTVIMAPPALSEYLIFLIFSMDNRQAHMGQSYFSSNGSTRIGEKIMGDNITLKSLYNHPRLPTPSFGQAFGSGGSQAGMLFSYGVSMQNHTWIESGVHKKLRDSPFWAAKNGRQPEGYPFNMVMDGTDTPVEELVSGVDKGIFISSFWYINPTDMNRIELTGLTRDGTFLIENGHITRPLSNFRFNDSPVRSLNRVTGMSDVSKIDGEYFPALLPHIRIDGFNLSSVSEAV